MVRMVQLNAQSRKSLPENESKPTGTSCGYHFQTGWNILGIPLVCIAFGRDEAGRARVAKGIIAIGKVSFGLISVGQFALGVLSIGQFGLGLIAVGQVALSVLLGVGQFSTGVLSIGQIAVGLYCLGQIAWGKYIWSQGWTDMEAVALFSTIKMMLLNEGGIGLDEVIRGGIDWGKDALKSALGR